VEDVPDPLPARRPIAGEERVVPAEHLAGSRNHQVQMPERRDADRTHLLTDAPFIGSDGLRKNRSGRQHDIENIILITADGFAFRVLECYSLELRSDCRSLQFVADLDDRRRVAGVTDDVATRHRHLHDRLH
jgi:hypothetical protein